MSRLFADILEENKESKGQRLLENIFNGVSKYIELNNETIKKNNEDMESLRQANMDLFKKIGSSEKPDETGIKQEPPKVYESYDKLAAGFLK